MGIYDILGFATGFICVWLLVRNNIWNWFWGIANAVVFLISFWLAGLFADSTLQIVYVGLNGYGWWAWLHGGKHREELPISHAAPAWLAGTTAFVVVATAVFATILAKALHSTVPLFDGFTTAVSLAAIAMQTRRILENWYLWIIADIVYIPLYVYKHLPLTGALYLIFLVLCVMGVRRWRMEMAAAPAPA